MAQVLDFGGVDNFNQVRHWQHGSVYYYGKVVVSGGLLPWNPIPVIVTCNGVTRMNTQADEKGEFRLETPSTDSEMGVSDNDPNRIVAASLAGCKVHAQMEGFQSSTLNIINNSIMDDPDIGTITLKRDERTTGAAVSATTLAAPPELLEEFARARSEAISHHPDAAQRLLQQIVIADPNFAEAWYQLGRLQEKTSPQDALNRFDKAVAADPDFISPYVHIAAVRALQKHWEASLTAVRRALKLDPAGSPQLWYFSALANLNLNQPRFAEASARTSLAMDPSHLAPKTEQLLAVILARRGDYAGALKHLRSNLSYISPGPDADLIKIQIAQVEKAQATAASR
jgi:cytochrome c-type biogenesis protein CcmH/NrfG